MARSDFEERRQARIDRLERAAEKARAEGKAKVAQADKMASVIPFGQPILIGHHSEKADRRYRDRIHKKLSDGFALQEFAGELEARAAAAAKNDAIFSDDPKAEEKLEEKIARLEQRQELMKTANKLIRKGDDAGLEALGFSPLRIAQLKTPDFCGRIGFEDFMLQNNNANIRRLKQRLAELKKSASEETSERSLGDVRIVDNVEDNRLQIFFPDKPVEAVRKQLKAHGFHWTNSIGCWQRYRGSDANYWAERIVKESQK